MKIELKASPLQFTVVQGMTEFQRPRSPSQVPDAQAALLKTGVIYKLAPTIQKRPIGGNC